MSKTSLNLDRQADGRIFQFGSTSAGGDALVTVNKGTTAITTVVLDVKGSTTIAGDLNLIGNLNITGSVDEQNVTNLAVTDINITVNKGGTTAGADGAGILVEGTSASVIGGITYDGSFASLFGIGDGTTQVEIVDVSSIQTLTNKSISGDQISSAVANATLAAGVTTNANLTGPITSVGNATSVASQTGTGSTFVMSTSPTLVTPNIGVATGTSLAVTGSLTTGTASSADGSLVFKNATNAFTQTFQATNPGTSITYLLPTTAPQAGQVLSSSAPTTGTATLSWADAGNGTVTSVSVVTANGISGSVATSTSTPAITLTLGAITPTSVNGLTLSSQAVGFTIAGGTSSKTLTLSDNATISGTNTGDQTTITGNAGSATTVGITNDTSTNATMYIGWYTTTTGNLPTKVSSTKLTFNPSTGILSATGFAGSGSGLTGTAASLTAGTVTTIPNLTGGVTSVGNVTTVVTNADLSGDISSTGNTTTLNKYLRRCVTSGTQDGTNKVFTIGAAIKTGSDIVTVNGQILNSGSSNDYIYDGTTTFTFQAAFTAPASTDVIQIFGVY